MPEFQDFKSAFQWWLENVYPDLPSEEKVKLRFTKSDFVKGKTVSSDLIHQILEKYGEIELLIKYKVGK
jgi:hypothetical protein